MVGDPGGPTAERETHNKAGLEFAITHRNKPKSFWENVLWTDETTFELFGKAHHLYCYGCGDRCRNLIWNLALNSVAWSFVV